MTPGTPTHATIGEENVRQWLRRRCDERAELHRVQVPLDYVRVSLREEK